MTELNSVNPCEAGTHLYTVLTAPAQTMVTCERALISPDGIVLFVCTFYLVCLYSVSRCITPYHAVSRKKKIVENATDTLRYIVIHDDTVS